MVELTIEQLNYVIQMQLLSFREALGENHQKIAFQNWYKTKKQNYSGPELQNQLERNAIYFVEATHVSKVALMDYLLSGEPRLKPEEVPIFVQQVGMTLPKQQLVPPLAAFLKGYIEDKPEQVSDLDYYRLRHVRSTGNRREYLKEIYEICKIFRTATGFMDHLLSFALLTSDLAGSAKKLQRYQVNELVKTKVLFHAGVSMDMVQFLGPDGKPFKFDNENDKPKKKRWKLF